MVVAIAGCSVGNNIANALMRDLRCSLKVADVKSYHNSNANRVPLNYTEIGQNKAVITASQIHAIDPFADIWVYQEGIQDENVDEFIAGNGAIEPAATVIVEETDNIATKFMIWEAARKYRKPLVMATDIGAEAVQIDIRRFDLEPNLPLAYNISDEALFGLYNLWRQDKGSKTRFFDFATALIGPQQWTIRQFRRIVRREIETEFGGIPQLGSTAMIAGGIAAKIIIWMALGYRLPERMFINFLTGEIVREGKGY
jgi:hypothetical protein